jgi:deoxyadenosine/deoxycytidine kinase
VNNRLILVAGNIGAGKTSLAARVGERLGWQVGYESVGDNPYLSDFYQDMRSWSFHLQIFFLGHRAEQHIEAATGARSTIIDRSIYEDAFIFARALHHLGNLTERDYHSYRNIYRQVINGLPSPDLLLFLKAPVDVLLERIRRRDREMERGIDAGYLGLLDSFYDDWMASFDLCPVLTIHSGDLDFVNKPRHLDIVIQRVEDRLSGHEQLILD